MGNRLLPAFDTATGIPYGTVNLRSGVPKGETELASTAGAGSLVIEFEVLSCLTGELTVTPIQNNVGCLSV
jgi:mannosidase alpha-like ER degradation enhancer 2